MTLTDIVRPMNGSLRRLKIATGIVMLGMVALVVTADVVAGYIGVAYRVEPLILGTLIGGLLLILGIEVANRWPFGNAK